MIENFYFKKVNVQFSIKRTGLQIFKTSLLNIPYDPKNGALNIYKTGTYNRELRVFTLYSHHVVGVAGSTSSRYIHPFHSMGLILMK